MFTRGELFTLEKALKLALQQRLGARRELERLNGPSLWSKDVEKCEQLMTKVKALLQAPVQGETPAP